jgi:hypothetical protein
LNGNAAIEKNPLVRDEGSVDRRALRNALIDSEAAILRKEWYGHVQSISACLDVLAMQRPHGK